MNLYAILSWYDESPTWLAGCVSSLTRIGVDHLIAVDGRYPHFGMGLPARSRVEQVDAITSTAHGAGMGVTVYQPTQPLTEVDKRTLSFRLLNAIAAPDSWVLVIDADEIVSEGTHAVRRELEAQPCGTHVVGCRVTNSVDPYARPSADNDVTSKTLELHQKIPVPAEFTSLQSRFFRVLNNMRCDKTHYDYTGTDVDGVVWNLRPDIGAKPEGKRVSDIGRADCTIQHRKNHRTAERREHKRAYYTLRDEIGLER